MPEEISAGPAQPEGEGKTAARGTSGGNEAGGRCREGTFRKRAGAPALFRDRAEDPASHRRPGSPTDRTAGEPDRRSDPKRDRGIGRIGNIGPMNLSQVIEALLFAAQKPLTAGELVSAVKGAGGAD